MADRVYTLNGRRGVWRTIGGRRVFISDGDDLATAMNKSGKFDNVKFKKAKDEVVKRKGVTAEEYRKAEDTKVNLGKAGRYEEALEAQKKYDDLMNKDGHITRKSTIPKNTYETLTGNVNLDRAKRDWDEEPSEFMEIAKQYGLKGKDYEAFDNYAKSKNPLSSKSKEYDINDMSKEAVMARYNAGPRSDEDKWSAVVGRWETDDEFRERVAGIKPAKKELENDWKQKNWRQDLLDTDKKSAYDIWKENEALYKEYGGFADTGDPVRNKEVEKAHSKWLRNRELARAKEKESNEEIESSIRSLFVYKDEPTMGTLREEPLKPYYDRYGKEAVDSAWKRLDDKYAVIKGTNMDYEGLRYNELVEKSKYSPEAIDFYRNKVDEAYKNYGWDTKKYNEATRKAKEEFENFDKREDDYSKFAGWELYSDDPNRYGDTMRKYNENQSLRQKYSGTIDYLQKNTDMSMNEILDLLRKRGK